MLQDPIDNSALALNGYPVKVFALLLLLYKHYIWLPQS